MQADHRRRAAVGRCPLSLSYALALTSYFLNPTSSPETDRELRLFSVHFILLHLYDVENKISLITVVSIKVVYFHNFRISEQNQNKRALFHAMFASIVRQTLQFKPKRINRDDELTGLLKARAVCFLIFPDRENFIKPKTTTS